MYLDQIDDINFENNLFRLQLYLRIEMYSIDLFAHGSFCFEAKLVGADPEAQLSGSPRVYPWRNNMKSLPTIPKKRNTC
jgi:hypothetical protein